MVFPFVSTCKAARYCLVKFWSSEKPKKTLYVCDISKAVLQWKYGFRRIMRQNGITIFCCFVFNAMIWCNLMVTMREREKKRIKQNRKYHAFSSNNCSENGERNKHLKWDEHFYLRNCFKKWANQKCERNKTEQSSEWKGWNCWIY